MAVIHVLDKHTAELIAAGEVVERPASVVKELLENAIDAGASQITVTIESGGVKLIEISDNGSGIEAEYIPTAFIRHATSKIRTAEDLLTVSSLGFRGEALSSIAAVSQVELITKTPSALSGVRYVINGGVQESLEDMGAPEGTTFLDSRSMVPASTATAISIPAPAIIRIVFQGTRAMISFCGASFISSAMTAKTNATKATSIFPATSLMTALPGISSLSSGKTRTTAIIATMR